MKENIKEKTTRNCPICGNTYVGRPSISRSDNETLICPDCGIHQSLDTLGISMEEQDAIIKIIHRKMD